MDNKKFLLKLKKSWFVILVLFILIRCILNPQGIKVLLFNISPNFINLILFLGILIFPIIFWVPEKREVKWIKISYNIIASIIMVLSLIIYVFLFSEIKYFNFTSPNGNRTLVVEEDSFLLSGRSYFYEKKFGIFIKSLSKEISTDDGFRPFSTDSYRLTWKDEDTVKIEYDFGSAGIWKNERIDFKRSN
ncbi:hypothetical protein [Clostridium tertium]|uniref:Uncharacterized protein n=1 Tax=Clostridium tertium TaxID=1559 RepID=A0A6N2Z0J2_9CLOT